MFKFTPNSRATKDEPIISIRSRERIAFNSAFCLENNIVAGMYVSIGFDESNKKVAFIFSKDFTNTAQKLLSDNSAAGLWCSNSQIKYNKFVSEGTYLPKEERINKQKAFVIEL